MAWLRRRQTCQADPGQAAVADGAAGLTYFAHHVNKLAGGSQTCQTTRQKPIH